MYLLLNFGSLGMVLMMYPLLYIYQFLIAFCSFSDRCRRHRRKLGDNLYWGALLRLLIESYMIGILGCFLNIEIISFDSANSSTWQILNAYFTVLMTFVFGIFPIATIGYMAVNFKALGIKKVKQQFGEFYEGLVVESRGIIGFIMAEYLRKISLALIIVFYQDHIYMHFLTLIMTSKLLIILSGWIKTRELKSRTAMDQFNEVKLLFIMYHIICFTAFVPDAETRFLIGYSCMAFVAAGLLINMADLMSQPILLCKHNCRIKIQLRKARKQRKLKQFNGREFSKRRLKDMVAFYRQLKSTLLKLRSLVNEQD